MDRDFAVAAAVAVAGTTDGNERGYFTTVTTSLSVVSGAGVHPDHQTSWPYLECCIFVL